MFVQTDDSWSWSDEGAEDDWLMREISAVLASETRSVKFDPDMSTPDLIQLINDELDELRRPPDPAEALSAVRPDEYVGRLQRFCSNIDYFLNS